MSNLKSVWFILAFALPLFGQVHQPREHKLGAEWAEDTVPSAMNYCDVVDDFSRQEKPPDIRGIKANIEDRERGRPMERIGKQRRLGSSREDDPPSVCVVQKRRDGQSDGCREAASGLESRRRVPKN